MKVENFGASSSLMAGGIPSMSLSQAAIVKPDVKQMSPFRPSTVSGKLGNIVEYLLHNVSVLSRRSSMSSIATDQYEVNLKWFVLPLS